MTLFPFPAFLSKDYHVWLLKSNAADLLSRLLNPSYILSAAGILVIGIVIMVIVIYAYLYFKKRNFFYTERIGEYLEIWIAQIITDESADTIEVPKRFYRFMKSHQARQFTVNQLILCKKNFSGAVSKNIVSLYIKLGLKEFSLQKLNDKNRWNIKARGIQELYLMNQMDCLRKIYKHTNSENDYIRTVAQNGVIHLTGFAGLRFLEVLSLPLTEWHQLKLIEQLKLHPKREDLGERIPKWLRSKNETVVVFALKLAGDYQEFTCRPNVINCLVHPHSSVRTQALRTLIQLADEKTASIILGYFRKEPHDNQVFILQALRNMATEKEVPFLAELLNHENDTIKLNAGIVLANSTENGKAILDRKVQEQPDPYYRIYQHIKTVQ